MSFSELILGGPAFALSKLIYEKVAGVEVEVLNDTELSVVRAETERQENEMRRLEAQAKVAQEMAIAARIENAVEVQIEEYFEYTGDGKLGLNADNNNLSIGVSASGKRISKRVLRFTGNTINPIIQQPPQGDGVVTSDQAI